MPFESDRPLEDYIDVDAVDRFGRRLTDAVGDRLQLNVRRETPVDDSPFRDRKDRPRGTARESVERGPVLPSETPRGKGWSVSVFSDDPVFPYIEYPTRPHVIRPRADNGVLSWRDASGRHFAREVHHPGTHGQYCFAKGTAKTDAEIGALARGPLREFEREVVK